METNNVIDLNNPLNIRHAFREKFFENVASLYEAEKLCDVTLIADDKRIPAHRLILSASTPYFAAMFTNNLKERNEQEIKLQEVRGSELKSLIDFCYTGSIDINETNVFGLLETASRIEFTLIEDASAQFLRTRLNASNCLSTWICTEPFINLKELSELAVKSAEENFIEVSKSHEFQLLDVDRLLRMLRSDNLNVYSEEEVFNAMSKWVFYDLDARKCHVRDLLKTVRLSELKSKFITENVTRFCEEMNELDFMKILFYDWKLSTTLGRPSTKVQRWIAFGNDLISLQKNPGSEIYCPTMKIWKKFEHLQCSRINFCCVALGEQLYFLGGFCENQKKRLTSVEKYNFVTKEVTEVEPMITARSKHAAIVLNNEIFVAGGAGLSSVERFNLQDGRWSNVASMLEVRRHLALVSLNSRIVAVGGRANNNAVLTSVESYDPFKKKWEFIAPMNRKRSSHSAVVHRDRLFVVGGLEGGLINDSVEYYDPTIDKWTLVEGLSVPLYGFGAAAFEDFMVIVGGVTKADQLTSSVIKLNFKDFSKENIASMNIERRNFSLIEVPCYNPDN